MFSLPPTTAADAASLNNDTATISARDGLSGIEFPRAERRSADITRIRAFGSPCETCRARFKSLNPVRLLNIGLGKKDKKIAECYIIIVITNSVVISTLLHTIPFLQF